MRTLTPWVNFTHTHTHTNKCKHTHKMLSHACGAAKKDDIISQCVCRRGATARGVPIVWCECVGSLGVCDREAVYLTMFGLVFICMCMPSYCVWAQCSCMSMWVWFRHCRSAVSDSDSPSVCKRWLSRSVSVFPPKSLHPPPCCLFILHPPPVSCTPPPPLPPHHHPSSPTSSRLGLHSISFDL